MSRPDSRSFSTAQRFRRLPGFPKGSPQPRQRRRRPYFVTVNTKVAEWVVLPLVAVTTSVKEPVFGPPETASTDVPEVSDDGENFPVGPTGLLLIERVTTPVKPPVGVTLSV